MGHGYKIPTIKPSKNPMRSISKIVRERKESELKKECEICGTELRYNAELTHDPTFDSEGVKWYYCSKCNVNYNLNDVYIDRKGVSRWKRRVK
jgi:C4-type Zn-finger protein